MKQEQSIQKYIILVAFALLILPLIVPKNNLVQSYLLYPSFKPPKLFSLVLVKENKTGISENIIFPKNGSFTRDYYLKRAMNNEWKSEEHMGNELITEIQRRAKLDPNAHYSLVRRSINIDDNRIINIIDEQIRSLNLANP